MVLVQGFFKGCKKWRSKFWNLRIIVPIHKKYCWFCNKFPNIFVINPLKWHFITFPIIFQPKCWQFVLCQWIIVGVNPSLLLYQMSLINEHNIYICPLILAFYRKTLTLRLFVLILQFNVFRHIAKYRLQKQNFFAQPFQPVFLEYFPKEFLINIVVIFRCFNVLEKALEGSF